MTRDDIPQNPAARIPSQGETASPLKIILSLDLGDWPASSRDPRNPRADRLIGD